MSKPAMVVLFSTLAVLSQLGLLASAATAPAPGPDCDSIIINDLAPCLDYVTPGTNTTTPPKDCCGGLSTIVKETPICLCQLLNSNGSTQGIPINATRAMDLPAACKITTPPTSECNNHGAGPTPAPAPSPHHGKTSPSPAPSPKAPSPSGNSSPPASMPPAPAPGPDCDSIILNGLAPCLDYVTPGTNTTTPPKDCCGGLSTIVKETPICLCQLLNGNGSTQGIPINATRAMDLPAACKITTPPTSECNNHGAGPTPAPAPSPHHGKTSPSPAPSPKAPSPSGNSSPPASMPPAPAPGPDCDSIILNGLAPCLDYVTPGTNTTTPPKDCCGGLSTIVKETPICLCQLLNGNGSTQGIPINATRAMDLPAACKITTPPTSECNNHGAGPTPAPAPSPHHGKTSPSPAPSPKAPSPSGNSSPLASMPPAPAPGPDCDSIILNGLAPCLDYVTPGTNTTTPPNDCCGGLSTIVKETPICLCQLLNGNGSTQGIPINATRAMDLPAACKITTPPTSECNNRNSSPPASSPPPSTESPGTPTAQGPSGGVSLESSVGILLAGLLLAVAAI